MAWITTVTFDQIALTLIACGVLREVMILTLPNDIAGPGGWLIDTADNAERG